MIAMRPIMEPDVINIINNGRYDGEIDGYVIMNGAEYLGHLLYRVDKSVTEILDTSLTDNMLVDGAVRAGIAAGEHIGANSFIINKTNDALAKWHEVFCKSDTEPYPNETIFNKCK
ncbi:MAG: hypothetical protein RR508_06450 [Oscillospiraceae bacterium]